MAGSRMAVPVSCPACGAHFGAQIEGVIDAGKDPQVKSQLLQGQINVAKCPQCGNEGPMNAPFLYHDASHELALVLMPPDLSLHNDDQQRIIGDMTNALVNSLPPEERKGYLLTPQTFFTMQNLVDVVLQADGISRDEIDNQRTKAQLIQQFLQAGDEESLRTLVKEHDEDLDYEFFEVLTSSALAAQSQGQADLAQALLGLRALLAEWSTGGREAVAEVNAAMGLGETITREELLERLQAAESEEEWEALVAAGRPLLDYAFFQELTTQIEAAPDADAANHLKALRSKILDTTAKQDEETRTAVQSATGLLQAVLEAEDRQSVLRENLGSLDDVFFSVLAANLRNAQEEGRNDLAQLMQQISEMAVAILEEQMPPELRFVNELMRVPYPDGTAQVLSEHRELITDQFLEDVEQIIGELEQAGQPAAAQHMQQVQEQAKTIAQS